MWNLQDAKNRFSALVDAALAGQPQRVSRRGKPAVVVLSAVEYDRISRAATAERGSFARHLLAFPGLESGPRPSVKPRDVDF